MTDELRVGAIRAAIEGLPDDAPAFVTVASWDLPLLYAGYCARIIDPESPDEGPLGWPERPGLELWAGPSDVDEAERERFAAAVDRVLAHTATPNLLRQFEVARLLGITRTDWPRLLEQARSVAVRLDAELADLRRAIEAIHTPKAVGMGCDPETPEIICATCRTDFPCETRAFSDALDPIHALDEFANQPDPF